MTRLRALLILFILATAQPLMAQDRIERPDLQALFAQHNITGTFVLRDVTARHLVLVNPDRAGQRYIPASTFKIANSLIALETGVIADENTIIPYGGAPQPIAAWARDMSMRDAVAISNVPVYQELARRVGLTRYAALLDRLSYGNAKTGADVEHFWLRGPLAISAEEQTRFLAQLATRQLPLSARSQIITRDILRLDSHKNATLYGKTGWTNAPDPDIGWVVGWVERDGRIFTFALNMDIQTRADARKRLPLAREFLAALEIIGQDTQNTAD